MKNIEIEFCERLPSGGELDSILSQFYELAVRRMRDMGLDIDPAAPGSALAEFRANSDDYLPPKGCLVVARKSTGEIVGCGMMKRLDPHTGELKRDFVTEGARGTGIGRALIEARESAARRMGLKRLVADSLTPSVEMRNLYPKLGFVELAEPIETIVVHRSAHAASTPALFREGALRGRSSTRSPAASPRSSERSDGAALRRGGSGAVRRRRGSPGG